MPSQVKLSSAIDAEQLAQRPNALSLKDKTVIITGGASGLGAAMVKEFASQGAYVTIADIQEGPGEKYAAQLRADGFHVTFTRTDVTSWPSQLHAFQTALTKNIPNPDQPTLDIVIAVAGIDSPPFLLPSDPPASLSTDPPEPPTATFAVNTIGVFYTTKLAQHYFSLPSPSPTASKSLILTSSTGAYYEIPLKVSYCASKWAVRGLFRTARAPLARQGIRTNLIAPWLMATPMTMETMPIFDAVEYPRGRVEDVVRAAVWFAVDEGICGRAVAVGPKRLVDLGDDREGLDGGLGVRDFLKTEVPGAEEKDERMLKMFGF